MGTGHILTAELHYHPMHLISSVLICILEKSETKKIQKIINNIIIKVADTIKKKGYHWYKMYLHFVITHFHSHHSRQTDLIQNSVQMLYTVPLVNAESYSMCT